METGWRLSGGAMFGFGVAILGASLGAFIYFANVGGSVSEQDPDAEAPQEQESAGTSSAVDEPDSNAVEAVAGSEEAKVSGPETQNAPKPPAISTFRLEPDGQMLVAGSAEPGWEVSVHLDDAVLGTLSAQGDGDFVEFYTLDFSNQPRVLSLSMTSPDTGEVIASLDEIIIAPSPQVVAQNGADEGTEASGEATAQTDVIEPEQQTVLLSDEEGVSVLQAPRDPDASPEVMSNVALDAITYSDEGNVQLSGRAQGDGFVRVYIDNDPLAISEVEEGGAWRSELPEIDTGVYTLRIDEIDAEGQVTSRVETPFKREDPDIVLSETNDERARVVTVQPGFTLWAISREAYGDGLLYVRVYEANKEQIRNPDLIYPGQVFAVPN